MKILINPRFLTRLEKIKNRLKPFEVAELEKALKNVCENPGQGENLASTNAYKLCIEIHYYIYIIIYEYDAEKDRIIFWSIE